MHIPAKFDTHAQPDEDERLLSALKGGPMFPSRLAAVLHRSLPRIQARLYRLEKRGLVHQIGGRCRNYRVPHTWALGKAPDAEKPAANGRRAQSRTPPDWRGTTLTRYDLDAHRRLAMMTRG